LTGVLGSSKPPVESLEVHGARLTGDLVYMLVVVDQSHLCLDELSTLGRRPSSPLSAPGVTQSVMIFVVAVLLDVLPAVGRQTPPPPVEADVPAPLGYGAELGVVVDGLQFLEQAPVVSARQLPITHTHSHARRAGHVTTGVPPVSVSYSRR